jgi:hypothetical protein
MLQQAAGTMQVAKQKQHDMPTQLLYNAGPPKTAVRLIASSMQASSAERLYDSLLCTWHEASGYYSSIKLCKTNAITA